MTRAGRSSTATLVASCIWLLCACGDGGDSIGNASNGVPSGLPSAATPSVDDGSSNVSPSNSEAPELPATATATSTSSAAGTSTQTPVAASTPSTPTAAPSPDDTVMSPPTPVDDGLPGRALIRRLSNEEYAATIATLLGPGMDYVGSFPEDTIVNGFANNTDVQDVGPALAEQYIVAAEAIANEATADTDALLGCALADGQSCVTDFVARFGQRAWRRPLTTEEQQALLALFEAENDPVVGVRLLLQALLTSPNFLYRAEVGSPVQGQPYAALTSWELATRLSYFLTGTMPDAELFAAAEADTLRTAEGIEVEARRLLATPAARRTVASFFSGWLNLRALERLQRDPEQFSSWDSRLPPLFFDETQAFVTQVVFDGEGDLPTLLTAPYTYGDRSLAEYYGGTAAADADGADGVTRIDLPQAERAGLLTHASFLATHSKEIQTDPVSRGKFVRERILCQGIPAPPANLVVVAPTITPGSTTRERFAQHEEDPTCAGCHLLIDPVGLAFEHYDPIGQWRDQEQGRDIDASGDLTGTDVAGAFDGVVEMANKLAQSEIAQACFVRYWFRFTFGRGESDSEDTRIATITRGFQSSAQQVQELLVQLTLTPDFRYLQTETPAP